MSQKRDFPLFIIDSSRSHGRGREKDFVACTSKELPWAGEITILTEQELEIDQDWQQKNWWCAYTDANSAGMRGKLKLLSIPYADKNNRSDIESLMRRCLKEWLLRRRTTVVNIDNVSNEAVVRFADILLEQTRENLRQSPDDSQARMVSAILTKIKQDYSEK